MLLLPHYYYALLLITLFASSQQCKAENSQMPDYDTEQMHLSELKHMMDSSPIRRANRGMDVRTYGMGFKLPEGYGTRNDVLHNVNDVLSESKSFFRNQHGRNSYPGGGTVNFKHIKGRRDQMVDERETRKMRETMLPSLRSATTLYAPATPPFIG